MPIHDLQCKSCLNEWEELYTKLAEVKCPHCNCPHLDIVFSRGPIMAGAARTRILNRASNPTTDPVSVYIRRDDK